jgi:PAS domain S-box-containing protein
MVMNRYNRAAFLTLIIATSGLICSFLISRGIRAYKVNPLLTFNWGVLFFLLSLALFAGGILFYYYFTVLGNERLKASESKYKMLFEKNPNPMWVADITSKRFLNVNEAALKFYGYTLAEFLDMTLKDIRPENEIPLFEAISRLSADLDEPIRSGIMKHRKKSGEIAEMEIFSHKVDYEGRKALLVSAVDVSGMKRAEENQRKSEQKYAELLEIMNEGLIHTDTEGRIFMVNKRFCEMTGYKREELIGKIGYEILLDSARHPYLKEKISSRNKGNSEAYEVEIYRKNMEKIWVRVQASPVFGSDGKVTGHLGVHSDITEYKRTLDALRSSEIRFRSLFESAPIGVASIDWQGRFLLANEAYCRMMGYTWEELRNLTFIDITSTEDMDLSRGKLADIISGKKDVIAIEKRYIRKNGELLWAKLTASAVKDEKGRFLHTINMIEDITQEKRMNEELKRTNLELNTFFYQASHDLKGPLSSILGLVNLAEEEQQPEKIHEYLDMIRRSSMRLDSILRTLLETIRIREDVVKSAAVDVKALFEEVLFSIKEMDGARDVAVGYTVSVKKEFCSDSKLLSSVIQNLLENSIKYRKKDIPDAFARVTIEDFEKGIQIKVSDNGIGIEPSLQDKIFTIFFKADARSKGSGLGLYIVKHIVDRLRGKISVSSRVGEGCTFTVYIPDSRYL